ncbi:hypothetical protein [Caulobacter sp.]|uniref:hypothetical protein n=1 Tax=Caulobacter sp. TaxID=78 RepID=UPI0031DBBC5A
MILRRVGCVPADLPFQLMEGEAGTEAPEDVSCQAHRVHGGRVVPQPCVLT